VEVSQVSVSTEPRNVVTSSKDEVFETALHHALSLPESASALRSIGFPPDELARRLRARKEQVWRAVAREDALLADAEERRDAAEAELAAFEKSRSRLVVRACLVVFLLAVIFESVWVSGVTDRQQLASVGLGITLGGGLAFWLWLVTFVGRAIHRARLRSRLKPDVLAAKLESARDALMRALVERGVVPEIRQLVNEQLHLAGGRNLTFLSVDGLYESSDLRYEVPTPTRQRLATLLDQRGGGTIGITGPRGVGKTTLIRSLCPRNSFSNTPTGTLLSVVVSAPVQYDGREFLLYLFATLCRAVLGAEADRRRSLSAGWSAALTPTAGWFRRAMRSETNGSDDGALPGSAPASVEGMNRLRTEAEDRLREIEWQQTFTTGWSGTLRLPANFAEAARRVDNQLTRRQRSYPQLTDDLRGFLANATAYGRVLIGIDELDKIESAGAAQTFLNDLKAMFGVDHSFFLISVSEDALIDFQRRALGFRNVFDSSFDEIVRVPYLTVDGSRQLLERRIIGLPDPFALLCHCLSGGLPRDLIRMARNLVELGTTSGHSSDIGHLSAALAKLELASGVEALTLASRADHTIADSAAFQLWSDHPSNCAPDNLLDHCRDLVARGTRPLAAEVQLLNLAYLCGTVIDLFADPRHDDGPAFVDSVEGLARARQALGMPPAVAWHAVSTVRARRGLEPLPYPEPSTDQ
jgi:hypothetical protein